MHRSDRLNMARNTLNIASSHRGSDMESTHNLLFQEINLADNASDLEKSSFLRKVPSQAKIDRFLKARERSNPSPRFAEFYELQIGIFVASAPVAESTRVVIAGVTNMSQKQFDTLAATIGRGTARWNRPEFIDSVESILGIKLQDYAAQQRA
jgi:hypothetical protein